MIYWKTNKVEQIAVHPLDDINSTQFIELVQYGETTIFSVWMDDGENEWFWEFDMDCPSDYERVKIRIFDVIAACETMTELAVSLDAVFEDDFGNILIIDECDCCDGCEGCRFAL